MKKKDDVDDKRGSTSNRIGFQVEDEPALLDKSMEMSDKER